MQIWVDADACPRIIKEILFRAAERMQVPMILVVTADIPLAAEVIGRGASALDPRGVLYTEENVPERLAMRNLMDQLRASGLEAGGGPAPWTQGDSRAFANQLDRLLSAHGKADQGR